MQVPDAPLPSSLIRIALASPSPHEAPLSLRVGQGVVADVLRVDAETGRAILSLGGRRLEAQVPPGLRAGETIRLVVAELTDARVVLRLLAETALGRIALPLSEASNSATLSGGRVVPFDATALLVELDLPDTAPFRAAAQALFEAGQPLSRHALFAVRNAMAGHPGPHAENARAVVALQSLGVAITSRSLTLARTAAPGPGGVPASLGDLLRDLVQVLTRSGSDLPATPLDASVLRASSRPGPPGTSDTAPGAPTNASTPARSSNAASSAFTAPAPAPTAGGLPNNAAPVPVLLTARPALLPSTVSTSPVDTGSTSLSQTSAPALSTASSQVPDLPGSPLRALALVLSQLAVRTASVPELLRVVQLIAEGPESKLVRALPASTEGVGQASPPDARTVLRAIAGSAGPPEPPRPVNASPSTPPPLGSDDGLPDVLQIIRSQITALHDRIEFQQLANAAALARSTADAQASARSALGATQSDQGSSGLVSARSLDAGSAMPTTTTPSAAPGPAPTLTLSIPLAAGGQFSTLELTVQPDGTSAHEADAAPFLGLHARFTLRLEHLGEVSADLRLDGNTLRCRLATEAGASFRLLSSKASTLRDRLQRAGFEVERLECAPLPANDPHSLPSTPFYRVDVGA
jgi:hypothetical protein